jgi:hypothetical protein
VSRVMGVVVAHAHTHTRTHTRTAWSRHHAHACGHAVCPGPLHPHLTPRHSQPHRQAEISDGLQELEAALEPCLPDKEDRLTVGSAAYAAADLAWQMVRRWPLLRRSVPVSHMRGCRAPHRPPQHHSHTRSPVTHHSSLITRHTSHVTRHTSQEELLMEAPDLDKLATCVALQRVRGRGT